MTISGRTVPPGSVAAQSMTVPSSATSSGGPSQTTDVSSPGTYGAAELVVRIRFVSEVSDVSSASLEATAMAILNHPTGWNQSGFSFVADASSDLRVVLAEGPRVDELCLPLETYGSVNCQNGPIVALNADRWRAGGADWDSTLDAYRTYLINHEVGHLIGLRHPVERCPTAEKISAAMEPQTNNLNGCRGNGIPLAWEVEWARNRPAVVGPDPSWDGPRPSWP